MAGRLLDALLTRDPVRRMWLSQALLAASVLAASVVAMHYFVWVGMARAGGVAVWAVASLGGMLLAYGLIRSGFSERFADPSLTVPQMVFAIGSGAVAYALVGAGRGGVFPIVMVTLMFGMFIVTPGQMTRVCFFAVTAFGVAMALSAWQRPGVYVPAVEVGHFILVATMMPAVSLLAARLARLRQRAREQRSELTAALERIRELATRDEGTGLFNRRHLRELMEQEHQRCVRSGHTFCVALLEVDVAAAGDALLHGVAQESLRLLRVADVLGYWGGQRFVLLMSDTRAPLARGGLERLRDRVAAARLLHTAPEARITLSAGLAEHHAGETVEQTLARVEAALAESVLQGRNRVVSA